MKSLKELFRIGKGPSSSHTMGPQRAAQIFLERNKTATAFEVTLYGSLAATGKGHQTDRAILEVLSPAAKVELLWEPTVFLPFQHNGMRFASKDAEREDTRRLDRIQRRRRCSLGRKGRRQQRTS